MCFGVFVQLNTGRKSARSRPVGYIIQESGCWEWTGGLDRGGYGKFWDGKKVVAAHRWLYKQLRGPIPDDLQCDHLCRNRRCMNPDHIEIVTPEENKRRGLGLTVLNSRKTHCKRGHPFDRENTRLYRGYRSCRTCHRESQTRWRNTGKY